MKRILLLFFSIITFSYTGLSQNGDYAVASPAIDTEIVRRCDFMNIEEEHYTNVVVTLTSISPDYFFTTDYRVRVQINDSKGKRIYKKTFKNAYLFIFPSGRIRVGIPNFTRVDIWPGVPPMAGYWFGHLNEKEGVWL